MSKPNGLSNKGGPSKAQKHLHSRVSYLYRAASYLAGLSIEKQVEEQDIPKQAVSKPIESQGIRRNQEERSSSSPTNVEIQAKDSAIDPIKQTENLSTAYNEASVRLMLSHVKGISRKSLLRLPSSMKHSICKRCHVLLIHGRNSTQRIENRSRGGKKPWANVLVITCNACGTVRHFPVGAKRPRKRKDRSDKGPDQVHSENTKNQT